MSILPGGSLARSLWTAPSLKASRRRFYVPAVIGVDAYALFRVYQEMQPYAVGMDWDMLPVEATVLFLLKALVMHAVLYFLLSIGRRRSFKVSREREQVEAGEITIDDAAARFCQWPQRRLYSRGHPVTISASGFPVIGAAFLTGPAFGLRALGADSYRWADPMESMHLDRQMRAVINPRHRAEWVLPFPMLSDHAIPEGYIGRSVAMIEAAEAMRKFQAERRANGAARSALKAGSTSFATAPVPAFTYAPYTGNVPEQVLELLSDMVSVRSEVSAMHILWSTKPGGAPQLTALVEAHHDRTTVAGDVSRALGSVPGGSRLEVRLMDPRETEAIRELGTVAVA